MEPATITDGKIFTRHAIISGTITCFGDLRSNINTIVNRKYNILLLIKVMPLNMFVKISNLKKTHTETIKGKIIHVRLLGELNSYANNAGPVKAHVMVL